MELFNDLSLKEISYIVNILGESTDINYLTNSIQVGDKIITYRKIGNELSIDSSTGEKVSVRIEYSSRDEKDFRGSLMKVLSHKVMADYILKDCTEIILSNDISLPEGYKAFENVQRHDLLNGLRVVYIDKDDKFISVSLGGDKICLKDIDKMYEFTQDGIISGNKKISLDGDKLIMTNGNPAPSLDTVESFDLDKEKERIKKFSNMDSDIHPFTKDALDMAVRDLDRKNRTVNSIKEFYKDEIKNVRRAIRIRNDFIDGVKNGVLTTDELDAISNQFRRDVRGKSLRK